MLKLRVGEEYAIFASVSGEESLLVLVGTLTEYPDSEGLTFLNFGNGPVIVHKDDLRHVVTSARRATVGDVLLQNGRAVLVEDEETRLWLLGEEEGLQKELDHRRKEELAAARAERGVEAKKRERVNRARKQKLRY